jgi:hypothetical protein
MPDVALRCACGSVRGTLHGATPRSTLHVRCCCDDCQAFARWTGRDDVVDELGASAIVMVSPSQVRITEGASHLRAMRLTPKGLVRWYADCCRTPVGNTLALLAPPFVGLSRRMLDAEDPAAKAAIGRVDATVQTRFATQPARDHGVLRASARALGLIDRALFAGRTSPSPFTVDGAWIAEPEVLSPDARAALRPEPPPM